MTKPRRCFMNTSPMKQPSALLPIAMSVAALALVLGHIAIFGVEREADEGAAAHFWQLLMTGQMPVVAYFALKWLHARSRTGVARARVAICRSNRGMCARLPVQFLAGRFTEHLQVSRPWYLS